RARLTAARLLAPCLARILSLRTPLAHVLPLARTLRLAESTVETRRTVAVLTSATRRSITFLIAAGLFFKSAHGHQRTHAMLVHLFPAATRQAAWQCHRAIAGTDQARHGQP